MSGATPKCSMANILPVRPMRTGLHRHVKDIVFPGNPVKLFVKFRRRNNVAAFPWIGSTKMAATFFRRHGGAEQGVLHPVNTVQPAVG